MGKHIKFTTESFFERLKDNPNYLNIEILTQEINNAYDVIECVCKKCGYNWTTTATKLIHRKSGCKKCSGFLKLTNEEFLERLSVEHPTITALEPYVNTDTKILVKCNVCNNEWKATPDKLHQGNGCPKCAIERKAKKNRRTQEEFEQKLAEVTDSIVVIGKYKNNMSKIKCKCLDCGHEWEGRANNLLRGVGCPECFSSKGEKKIKQWLENKDIQYISQKTFDNCVYRKSLRFDFYLPSLNMAIEYDGIQHFQPIDFGFHDDERKMIIFRETVEKDEIKNNYCANNGINLLRIPYTEFDNIETILSKNVS